MLQVNFERVFLPFDGGNMYTLSVEVYFIFLQHQNKDCNNNDKRDSIKKGVDYNSVCTVLTVCTDYILI